MKITILTLFPDMFQGPFSHSIVKIAQEKELVTVNIVNIRDFGLGKHKVVDDTGFGGGIGMVMRVDVLHAAIQSVKKEGEKTRVILLDASGKTFDQEKAQELTEYEHLILICAHYEGVDERIREYIDEEISIGDFVLTGGELPAMLITDSVTRLISGVLKESATKDESFSLRDESGNTLIEYPQYTQPRTYEGKDVPEVLLSGNHKAINEWKVEKAKEATKKKRPDLLRK